MVKVKRKVNFEKYLVAAIITMLIFMLGLSMGFVVDYKRMQQVDQDSKVQELDYSSLQLQYLFLSTLDFENNASCSIINSNLKNVLISLGETLDDIDSYKENSKINKDEYDLLLRKFFLDNMRYWFLVQKNKNLCGSEAISLLYFYTDDCSACENQGVILTYYRNILKDKFLVFPINVDLEKDENFISVLRQVYGVENFPTLVVNDKVYNHFMSRNELRDVICEDTENRTAFC